MAGSAGRRSDRALSDAWLTSRITEIHERARGVYGSRRVQAELRLGQDIQVSRRRVRRLMRQAGISGLVKVKRGRTTIRVPGVRVADDLVERKFRPDAPNVLWVADITYLQNLGGLALPRRRAGRLQPQDRRVGDDRAHAHRARRRRAADGRPSPPARTRPHPSQRSGIAIRRLSGFGQQARDAGIAVSMGSKGDAYDNAVAESFFATLKKELVHRQPWPSRRDLVLGRLRVHRGVLQPPETTLHSRIPLPRGVRERENHNHEQPLATKAQNCPRKRVHSSIDRYRSSQEPERHSGAWANDTLNAAPPAAALATRTHDRVCEVRQRTGWGPRLIASELGMAHATVSRCLTRRECRGCRPPSASRSAALSGRARRSAADRHQAPSAVLTAGAQGHRRSLPQQPRKARQGTMLAAGG